MKSYKTYKFKGQDPLIDDIKTMFIASDLKKVDVSTLSGVSSSTFHNWLSGRTKRPQAATLNAVGRTMGQKLAFVANFKGSRP